jgi:hypothetical protein
MYCDTLPTPLPPTLKDTQTDTYTAPHTDSQLGEDFAAILVSMHGHEVLVPFSSSCWPLTCGIPACAG